MPNGVRRVYRFLSHPQALDDANKGIIDELKKTSYRDLLKEKSKFLEPLRRRLHNSPCVLYCQSQLHVPVASPVPGLSTVYRAF